MNDPVYRERAHLVALLATLFPSHIGYTDQSEPEWAVVIVHLPTGQCAWHIAPDDMDLFQHVKREDTDLWDGHTTEQKYERIREFNNRTLPLVTDRVEPRGKETPF